MAPVPAFSRVFYEYWLVFAFHQALPGQRDRIVVIAGGVETPILMHAVCGVATA